MHTEHVPTTWKQSIIIPLYKGNGTPKNDPNRYRHIALIPCLSILFVKFIREDLLDFMKCKAIVFPNRQQQRFQEGFSCTTSAFTYCKQYIIIVKFFHKLCLLGVTGKTWCVIHNSYRRLTCCVRINNNTSRVVNIERGIRNVEYILLSYTWFLSMIYWFILKDQVSEPMSFNKQSCVCL